MLPDMPLASFVPSPAPFGTDRLADMPISSRGRVRLATRADDAAIHRLNYRTFVEEIPQHDGNEVGILVDRFHDENTYAVYEVDGQVVGMIAARTARPLSLDQKLGNLDAYLPPYRRIVELRLLAVERPHRNGRVFVRLARFIAEHFASQGYDLAVISGTTRQLHLYHHLGFRDFGPLVGREGAWYQPMYLTLDQLHDWPVALRSDSGANFLPGPVQVAPAVREAMSSAPLSHRSAQFRNTLEHLRHQLAQLVNARNATIVPGTGTLANDMVAAQLSLADAPGLVLTNGEFGDRLVDHATRFGLQFDVLRKPWGEAFSLDEVASNLRANSSQWLWFVHGETSTGVLNDLPGIATLASLHGVRVAVDAISTVGCTRVNARSVWMATATSGKGLASYPGLAIVFHDGTATPSQRLPRYLDLGYAIANNHVPFTHSSNLVSALQAAVGKVHWHERHVRIANDSARLRCMLQQVKLPALASEDCAHPAVHTIPLPAHAISGHIGSQLRALSWLVSFESAYLLERNWIQVCFMGEYDSDAIESFVHRLHRIVSTSRSVQT